MQEISKAAHLRRLLRELKISTVLDLGANRGQFVRFLREAVGFSGTIHAVEPNPTCVKQLRSLQQRDRNLQIWPVAVVTGENCGKIDLRVAAADDLSSVLPFGEQLGRAFAGGEQVSTIEVDSRSLDGLLQDVFSDENQAGLFVKSDLQGYDLEVLRSSRRALSKVQMLMVEAQAVPLYEGAPLIDDHLRFLREQAYDIAGIYRTGIVGYPRIAYDFDLVAIKRLS
jgi:FkbM family methyltransferase